MHLLELGKYADALRAFEAILTSQTLTSGERARMQNKRGVALVRLERRDDARRAFESALATVTAFAPALVNIGNLYLESGEIDTAIGFYERAIRSDDEYALAHHHLGVAYKRQGRTAEAVGELRRAQRLEGRVRRKQRQR